MSKWLRINEQIIHAPLIKKIKKCTVMGSYDFAIKIYTIGNLLPTVVKYTDIIALNADFDDIYEQLNA